MTTLQTITENPNKAFNKLIQTHAQNSEYEKIFSEMFPYQHSLTTESADQTAIVLKAMVSRGII